MVATVRCEEIANEKFASFIANEVKCLDHVLILVSDFLANIHIYTLYRIGVN